jgi:PIN domain
MFKLLVDTCVWLDLAKEPSQHPVIGVVEQMVREKLIELIVPTIVVDEFRRNRERIERDSARSLSTHFKLVREAVGKVGGNERKTKAMLAHLDDVNHKIPIVGGTASQALDRIEKMLMMQTAVEPSDQARLRAVQRAMDRMAPFHRGRNSMADALLIEIYGECVSSSKTAGLRFAFVTHNKDDFSLEHGNRKLPHDNLRGLFSRIKSLYFINLVEALRRVDPSFVSETMFEYSYRENPRGLHEILEAEELLFHQVWYNRHTNLRWAVEHGKIKIVDRDMWVAKGSNNQKYIFDTVYEGAKRSAAKTRKKHGPENFGPWTDFEWGMLNGKLSALRWVMGDEWDMLDT